MADGRQETDLRSIRERLENAVENPVARARRVVEAEAPSIGVAGMREAPARAGSFAGESGRLAEGTGASMTADA